MRTLLFLILLSLSGTLAAAEVRVATASNFLATLRELAPRFEAQTGITLRISAASTGKLYAQIRHGAPFDVLLSADARRPQRLEQEGYAVQGSRFTYANGQLVLWRPASADSPLTTAALQSFSGRLAIANPKTAPYGEAARSVLEKLGLWEPLQPQLIRGENIGQTFQFVASGNAAMGLVAHAQVVKAEVRKDDYSIIDTALYPPLTQQAVLLSAARNMAEANRFLAWLQQDEVRTIIRRHGYSLR